MCAKIAVAMSGGVDSSVAAWLLQQQGHELTGLTMELFHGEHGLPKAGDTSEAPVVAAQLGIPHHMLDLAPCFLSTVVEPFVQAYERGETPNPCCYCNRTLKFGQLLDEARKLGCDQVATGHYVRKEFDEQSGRWLIRKAVHPEKDQSYVLYSLTQEQLAGAMFPLGELSKDEIRAIAQEHGLVSAHKSDSQDICFIPDGDYAAFIRKFRGHDYPSGSFLDEDGKKLGDHEGIIQYTIGQRRGLGVSSNHGRLYVKEVRPEDNTVVLSENSALFSTTLTANHINFIPFDRLDRPVRLLAKVRYRMKEQPCTVEQTGPDTIKVTFDQPQRAVTPGQAVVLYDGDLLVGGATILKGDPQ